MKTDADTWKRAAEVTNVVDGQLPLTVHDHRHQTIAPSNLPNDVTL